MNKAVQTKRQVWERVAKLITLKQLERTMFLPTYDHKFLTIHRISKSKKIMSLCVDGINAPLTGVGTIRWCSTCETSFDTSIHSESHSCAGIKTFRAMGGL